MIQASEAERLMKRCLVGSGPDDPPDDTNALLWDCHGAIKSLVKERDAYREALASIKRHQEIASGTFSSMSRRSTTWSIADAALRRFDNVTASP